MNFLTEKCIRKIEMVEDTGFSTSNNGLLWPYYTLCL